MKKTFYKLKTAHRTVRLVHRETRDQHGLKLKFSAVGDLGDMPEIIAWLRPIFEALDGDGKPIVMRDPVSGRRAMATDFGVHFVSGPTH